MKKTLSLLLILIVLFSCKKENSGGPQALTLNDLVGTYSLTEDIDYQSNVVASSDNAPCMRNMKLGLKKDNTGFFTFASTQACVLSDDPITGILTIGPGDGSVDDFEVWSLVDNEVIIKMKANDATGRHYGISKKDGKLQIIDSLKGQFKQVYTKE